jgi:hypothetical protein
MLWLKVMHTLVLVSHLRPRTMRTAPRVGVPAAAQWAVLRGPPRPLCKAAASERPSAALSRDEMLESLRAHSKKGKWRAAIGLIDELERRGGGSAAAALATASDPPPRRPLELVDAASAATASAHPGDEWSRGEDDGAAVPRVAWRDALYACRKQKRIGNMCHLVIRMGGTLRREESSNRAARQWSGRCSGRWCELGGSCVALAAAREHASRWHFSL